MCQYKLQVDSKSKANNIYNLYCMVLILQLHSHSHPSIQPQIQANHKSLEESDKPSQPKKRRQIIKDDTLAQRVTVHLLYHNLTWMVVG